MSFVENQEKNAKYRGYNPEFVERVLAKRRKAAEAAREAEYIRSSLKRMNLGDDTFERVLESGDRVATVARIKREIRSDGMINGRPTVRRLMERACIVFNVYPSEIKGSLQTQRITFARWFVFYWASRLTAYSYPQIGRILGGKDHTTVLNGKSKYRIKRAKMGRYLREAR